MGKTDNRTGITAGQKRKAGMLAVIQDADMQNMYFGFRMVPGESLDDWYIVLDSTTEKRFQDLADRNDAGPGAGSAEMDDRNRD